MKKIIETVTIIPTEKGKTKIILGSSVEQLVEMSKAYDEAKKKAYANGWEITEEDPDNFSFTQKRIEKEY